MRNAILTLSPPSGILSEVELARSARSQTEATAASLRADLGRLNGSLEAQVRTVAGLTDSLTRAEREGLARAKDLRDRQAELRTEMAGVGQQAAECVRREVEARLDNLRRNLVEMIGSGEIRVGEVEDRVKVSEQSWARNNLLAS